MKYVIGLDIGTTSTIGILIGMPDKVLATASCPVTLHSPYAGWAEEEPEEWWRNVKKIIPKLLCDGQIRAGQVGAVGVSGMLPALVILDGNDRVIRNSIQQSDGRSAAEVAELAQEVDTDAFTRKAGNGINQQLIAAKLRWLERNEPENFARIRTVFGSYDYINWKLSGTKAVEQNWALEAGFIELETGKLSTDLIELGHITADAVPPKRASHDIMGHISAEGAKETGLPVGIPIAGGAADHIASGFAAGIVAPGDVLLKFGGAADILISTSSARPDARMFLDYHLIPGLFMPNGCMASGGSALNWFVDKFAQGERLAADAASISLHRHLDLKAAETPAGADGVEIIPYFLGEKTPIHDPEARGIINGLSLNHNISHVWRALLEGFAYAFRHHIEVFADMGHPSHRIIASDGGSKSKIWMQICADVLQAPIQLLSGHPGSSLGAAWVAAIASGISHDWNGADKFVTYGDLVEPNQANAKLYDEGYRRFREVYQRLYN